MHRRLNASERDAVREHYADHPVMRMLTVPCQRMETRLGHLRPKREEVFVDVFCILDDFTGDIRTNGIECDALWFQLMNENREAFATGQEDELEALTAHTLAAVVACLTACGSYPWDNYQAAVYRILQAHRADATTLVSAFVGQAERIPDFGLQMRKYMDGDMSLADEVEESFESLPDDEHIQESDGQAEKGKNSQLACGDALAILHAMYLKSGGSRNCDARAFARFAEALTGYSSNYCRKFLNSMSEKYIDLAKTKAKDDVSKLLKDISLSLQ